MVNYFSDIASTSKVTAKEKPSTNAYSILGKRIKRLGVYSLLKENKTIEESATFMKGMGWRDIDKICIERRF